MRLIYPVRLAVRSADATQALHILDAPFEPDDDQPHGTAFDPSPNR
jgi:hypothetical protein